MAELSDVTLSAAAMRVVKLLVGTRPQTVAQLMNATGVTRTAVTEQLNELVAGGFVERGLERLPGRGRPRHIFKATEASLVLLFASNQRLVVPAIWTALAEMGGDRLIRDVMRRVSQTLAEHYSRQIKATEPAERLQQFVEVLAEEGALVEVVSKDGELVLHRRSCPFISIVDEKRAVCSIDLDTMSAVIGRPVRRVGCRHLGDPCCSFALAEQNGKP